MGGLSARGPVPVEVTDREPERVLAWRVRAARRGRRGSRSSSPRAASAPRSRSPPSTRAPTRARRSPPWRGCSMSSDRPSDAPSAPPERPAELAASSTSRACCACAARPCSRRSTHHLRARASTPRRPPPTPSPRAVGLGFDRAQSEVAREVGDAARGRARLRRRPRSPRSPPPTASSAEQAPGTSHYEAGYRLARGAGIPERVCGWLLRARERYRRRRPRADSTGDAIPIEARLIRAACVCQTALTAAEARGGRPVEATVEALAERAGVDLDPRVVAALTTILAHAADA